MKKIKWGIGDFIAIFMLCLGFVYGIAF